MEVAAGYSTVREDDLLSKLVSLYQFEQPQACLFWARGVNDTYQLLCNETTYSLRVYRHGLRTLDAIQFEFAALNHLHERGLSVANSIAKKDGFYITALQAPEGLRYAIVTEYAYGEVPDYKDLANASMYGEAVAQLHNLSGDFVTDYHRPRLEVEYLLEKSVEVVRPFLAKGSDELEVFKKTAEVLRNEVAGVRVENHDTGLCHGDCHGGNVHKANGILTHFDFDCCGLGLRVFDLATFKWRAAGSKDADAIWSNFLTAYQGGREVREADLSLISPFIAIRHIWWMALRCGNVHDFGNNSSGELFLQRQIRNMKLFSELK